MAIDTSAVQAFTDAELLVLYRAALAAVATGQSYAINGRQLTRANLKDITAMIDWLDARVADAATATSSASGGGIAQVQFGEA